VRDNIRLSTSQQQALLELLPQAPMEFEKGSVDLLPFILIFITSFQEDIGR
jgi:hypothetical protein